jgi:hypothetical protein
MVAIYCLEIFRFHFKILRDISVILMHDYLALLSTMVDVVMMKNASGFVMETEGKERGGKQ